MPNKRFVLVDDSGRFFSTETQQYVSDINDATLFKSRSKATEAWFDQVKIGNQCKVAFCTVSLHIDSDLTEIPNDESRDICKYPDIFVKLPKDVKLQNIAGSVSRTMRYNGIDEKICDDFCDKIEEIASDIDFREYDSEDYNKRTGGHLAKKRKMALDEARKLVRIYLTKAERRY